MDNTNSMLIKQIHLSLEKMANNTLRTLGLTVAQVEVLFLLNNSPNKQISLKDLEKKLHVAQSTTVGIVSRLKQKKFVESFGDQNDKRIKIIKITDAGKKICLDVKHDMDETERTLLSSLTDIEKDIFHQLLQKVNESLK